MLSKNSTFTLTALIATMCLSVSASAASLSIEQIDGKFAAADQRIAKGTKDCVDCNAAQERLAQRLPLKISKSGGSEKVVDTGVEMLHVMSGTELPSLIAPWYPTGGSLGEMKRDDLVFNMNRAFPGVTGMTLEFPLVFNSMFDIYGWNPEFSFKELLETYWYPGNSASTGNNWF